MIKVCLSGLGKTGKEIAKALLKQDDIKLVSALCRPGSEKEGKLLDDVIGTGDTNIVITGSNHIIDVVEQTKPDVVVDFTNSEAALKNAEIFTKMGVNILVGTTGFSEIGLKRLMILSHKNKVGLLYAPNITTGVNVMMMLTNLASSILSEYDFQITEVHHKQKKDSPSGTAKKIALEIHKGLKSSGMDTEIVEIPINSVRAGGVVGKHEVMLVSEYDKIEISHESFSRTAFALGAIKGIRFLEGKKGYFEMSDVLDLNKVLNKYIEKDSVNKIRMKMLKPSVDIYNDDEVISIK